ncbi:MAG: sterol carrier family protein [Euryarchaeota archaeon]|nr:sterol carrier family protein [Euryarchaeota archaeon]
MSKIVDDAVIALKEKMSNTSFEGSAKFEIESEGSIVISEGSVYASDDPADVTFTASVQIFEEIFNGELEPTAAFMTGKLKIDGDMGTAMRLANVFG